MVCDPAIDGGSYFEDIGLLWKAVSLSKVRDVPQPTLKSSGPVALSNARKLSYYFQQYK